jgi:prolyl oligopeptidase
MFKTSRSIVVLLWVLLLAFDSLPAEKAKYQYPETKKIKVVETFHGIEVTDNYRWLEDLENPEVQAWIDNQNHLSREFLENLPQRKWAIDRFSYFNQYYTIEFSEKIKVGNQTFWQEKKKGEKNWSIWVRENKDNEENKEDEKNPARKLLDMNEYGPYTELWLFIPSPDGKYLAFIIEDRGKENNRVQIIDVASAKIQPDTFRGWRHAHVEWLPDSSGFYYSASPKKGEVPDGEEYAWSSLYFHKPGNTGSPDKKIFYHPTEKTHMHWAEISESKKYVFFYRGWYTGGNNEIFFKKVGSDEPLIPLAAGFDASYQVEEMEDKFIIQTDWKAPRGRVFIADPDKPGWENWKEFIPEAEENLDWHGIRPAAGYVMGRYLDGGASRIKIFDKTGRYLRDIPLPNVGTAGAGGKWDQPEIKVNFSTFTQPFSLYKYDFKTNTLTFQEQNYPLEVDVSNYITRRVFYRSKDGTRVSMFLLQRKDLALNSANPTLLHGYGGFNKSVRPIFRGEFIPWLEAGGMVAIPNLRGGGEYGRDWYEGGIGRNKQNSFDDCIAAAEWLIENKYTNPGKLALQGTSNGGLMVIAVAVQRPDLFKAVWSHVPFTDMVRFNKFGRAKLWTKEYGNPDDPGDFKAILAYSPYHNVRDGISYPAVLLTAGENDVRCHPLHAMKMAARLQAANKGKNPILLWVVRETGHDPEVTSKEFVIRQSESFAFLVHHLGMQSSGKTVISH